MLNSDRDEPGACLSEQYGKSSMCCSLGTNFTNCEVGPIVWLYQYGLVETSESLQMCCYYSMGYKKGALNSYQLRWGRWPCQHQQERWPVCQRQHQRTRDAGDVAIAQ